VHYLLRADDGIYRCRSWSALVERLVWAHEQGYKSAKVRRCAWEVDRALMPPESAALVEAATALALAGKR
jgi:hypothetical protein